MRTPLIINDELLQQARIRAAEWNLTVSDVVNNALREYLRRPVRTAAPFSSVTYGHSGKRVHHEPAEFDAVLDQDDQNR